MEDAALRACRTALDIQERMYRLQDEFQASSGVKPLLRIGIQTGPPCRKTAKARPCPIARSATR